MPRTNYNWPVSLIDRGYLTRRHVPFTYTLPWRLSSPCENLRAENARSSRTTKLDMSAKRGCVSLAGKYVLSSLKKYYIGGGARWLLKKQPTRGRGGGEERDNFLGKQISNSIRHVNISTVCIEFCFPRNF